MRGGIILTGDFYLDKDEKFIKGYIVDPKELKNRRKEGFILAIQDGLMEIAKMDIKGVDYKVLMYLLGILEYNNYICISQQAVGDQLRLKRQQVSLAIKRLIEKDIIIKGDSIGNQNTYRINDKFFVKGKKAKVSKTIQEIKENISYK